MDLKEISVNTGNCVGSVHDSDYWRALVNAAFNLRISKAMELQKVALSNGITGEFTIFYFSGYTI